MRAIKNFLYAHRLAWVPILLVAFCAWYMSRQHHRIMDAERGREAAELALKGQIVEHESTRRALQSDVQTLLKENTELGAAVTSAIHASPGAKPASVSRLDTGPLTIEKVPAPPTTEPCVVSQGQHLSVEVDQVELLTEGGNTLAVGAAKVYVLDPVKALLVRGPFRANLSTSAQLEQPRAPRWGVEVTYRCGAGGCGPGAGVLFPPFTLPLLGWRVEGRAGASLGAVAGVEGAAGVRF